MTASLKKLTKRREELLAQSALLREQLLTTSKSSPGNLWGFTGKNTAFIKSDSLLWLSRIFWFMDKFRKSYRIISWASFAFTAWKLWKRIAAPLWSFANKTILRKGSKQ